MICIFTDGGVRGNGKEDSRGGYGAYLTFKESKKEINGVEESTTNNRMELMGLIEGLRALKTTNVPITVIADSAYVVNCFKQGWYKNWRRNGWKNSNKEPVENRELWEKLLELVEKQESIIFQQIKGHIVKNLKELEEMNEKTTVKIDKFHAKFNETNNANISRKLFVEYVYGNTMADNLAGMY